MGLMTEIAEDFHDNQMAVKLKNILDMLEICSKDEVKCYLREQIRLYSK